MPRHRVRLLGISLGLAFVALLLPDSAAAAPIHSNAQYLGGISNAITQLVSTRGGLLLQVGWDEFLLFSGFAITLFLIKTALANRHHGFFDLAGFILLLGRMAFASIFLTLYMVPLGSSGISFSQLPTTLAHGIADKITQGMLDPLLQQLVAIGTGIEKPSFTHIIDIAIYLVTLFEMGVVSLILFAVNAYAFLVMGILTLFGPIFIPLLVTNNFSSKFYNWVGLMFQYAMLTPVLAASTYVWTMFFTTFFSNSLNGDYSLAHFLALTGALVTMIGGFFYTQFKLPGLAAEMFGGGGNIGASVANRYASFARKLIRNVARG